MLSFIFFLIYLVLLNFFWKAFRAPSFDSPVSLMFDAPRSGKTTFLVKFIKYARLHSYVYTNIPGLKSGFCNSLSKDDIGSVCFEEGGILVFDEGSLNGFDNRDFRNNFGFQQLDYFKLIGHYKNRIVFGNQGYDELDKKIRTLTTCLYVVRRLGPFSMAVKIYKYVGIDKESKQIIDAYRYPNLFDIIFNLNRSVLFVFRPRYYRYFDSYDRPLQLRSCDDPVQRPVSGSGFFSRIFRR